MEISFQSEVTQEEFCKLFENTCENTASSPSGIHIGHYKVAASIPLISTCLDRMIYVGITIRKLVLLKDVVWK